MVHGVEHCVWHGVLRGVVCARVCLSNGLVWQGSGSCGAWHVGRDGTLQVGVFALVPDRGPCVCYV